MMQTISVDIAGIGVALHIADAAMAAKTREKFAGFLSAGATNQVSVRVEVSPGAQFISLRPGPMVIDTALIGERLTFRSFEESGWVDFERGTGVLELAPEAEVENFLRVLYAHLCTQTDALLLHAAGIVRNACGYVFFGPSGSGKSTSSRLSLDAGCVVLSDDLVIVRKADAAYRVYGTPFHGTAMEIPRTRADAPLAGVYALVKDRTHFVLPLDTSRAVAALARTVPFVMGVPVAGRAVIAFCAELARTTRVAELHFRKDDGFWRVIDGSRETIPSAA